MTNQLRLCLAKHQNFTIIPCTLSAEMIEPIGLEQEWSPSSRARQAHLSLIISKFLAFGSAQHDHFCSAQAVLDLNFLAQLSSSKSRLEPFWLSLARAKIVKLTIPAPYRHERKFSGTPVCSHLIYIQSFGTLGQPFKIPPLSDQICHSAGVVGVPNNLF